MPIVLFAAHRSPTYEPAQTRAPLKRHASAGRCRIMTVKLCDNGPRVNRCEDQ
ncbi:hypothetical protein BV133_428 [Blastochloris viridis]|uniref:Uncharacterized protein n=1 Tax=Blastochloris viridis TaxID=1079 RepID=A0A182CZH3_BLAVI|nr:hypothetical protein BV133_428 [Blastochloris viridis]